VNQQFFAWLTTNYSGLFNYPAISPLMVHHIPGFVAHQFAQKLCQRAAFILLDGMAIDSWLLLRDALKSQGLKTPLQENALFAWIPTVTPISRQAAFSGTIPRYFPETLLRTDRDQDVWKRFWGNRNLSPSEIAFVSVPGDHADLAEIEDACTPQVRALGITLFKIDKIMHGTPVGNLGMASEVRTWAGEGFLFKLLTSLAAHGFDVFISADHAGAEAQGIGRPKEGVLSEKRGERCRIYTDPALQKTCLSTFPQAIPWNNPGLPDNICSLLAPQGKAFTDTDKTIVCHGGAALEEVCVPFVHIPSHA
jgi:hypothetical protein